MVDAYKAWDDLARRAAEGRFAGIRADSLDEIDQGSIREAAINPNAAGAKAKGETGPGGMPPVMGGAGGSAGAATGAVAAGPAAVGLTGGLRGGGVGNVAGGASMSGGLGGVSAGGLAGGAGLGSGSRGPFAAEAELSGQGVDVDGDGIADYFTGVGSADRFVDSDGDGVSDYDEWLDHVGAPAWVSPGATGGSVRPGDWSGGAGGDASGGPVGGADAGGAGGAGGADAGGSGSSLDPLGPSVQTAAPPPVQPQPANPDALHASVPDAGSGSGWSQPTQQAGSGATLSTLPQPSGSSGSLPLSGGGTPAPSSGGGSSYSVSPEELRTAARKWYELSESVRAVQSVSVPANLGFAQGAEAVPSLGYTATDWATKASAEYRSIGDKLMSAAETYAGTETWSATEAGKVGS